MNKVVSFHYTLKDQSGAVLEASNRDEPMSFLEGAGQIIPGLESALKGMKKGEKKSVFVASKDAYGEFDEELIVSVPLTQIPKKDVKVGDQFHADSAEGHSRTVVVTEVKDNEIIVDGNHPLSGQDLNFAVEIVDVRSATKEELSHGHAHGPGGHNH